MVANYLAWLAFGSLVGWLMSQILPAQQRSGQLRLDIILGATSAFGTGILMQLVIRYPISEFNLAVLIVCILGSVVALATHRTFVRT